MKQLWWLLQNRANVSKQGDNWVGDSRNGPQKVAVCAAVTTVSAVRKKVLSRKFVVAAGDPPTYGSSR